MLLSSAASSAEPARPLIFLPGILGSRLVEKQTGDLVWGGRASYINFRNMALPRDESKIRLRPDGVIESIPIVWPFKIKQYDRLLEVLREIGYKENENLFVFSYDWRRSNFETARLLEEFVQKRTALKTGQFDLLGHSMGGLVSLIFLHEQPSGSRVKRFVALGTPFLGSLNALEASLNGFSGVADFMSKINATSDEIRAVMLSFESGYELLPSTATCCVLGAPKDPGRKLANVFDLPFWRDQWLPPGFSKPADKTFVAESLQRGSKLSQLVRKPIPDRHGVFIYAGDNFDTRSRIYLAPNGEIDTVYEGNGDGTVQLVSAARSQVAQARVSFAKHARIFADKGVEAGLERILAESGELVDFAAEAGNVPLSSKTGRSVVVDLVSFEIRPPVTLPGKKVEFLLSLSGGEVQNSAEEFSFKVCASAHLKPPEPRCAHSIPLVEAARDDGPRRFTGTFQPASTTSYTAHLQQAPEIEDYFAVVAAD